MHGHELRELLSNPETRDHELSLVSGEVLSRCLSHVLTAFDFNSWQYSVISEACERLSPTLTPEQEDPDEL